VHSLLAILLLLTFQNADDECWFIRARDLADKSAPKFEQYSAEVTNLPMTAKLDLKSHDWASHYRTVIRQQMKAGPNFADHYRVAGWGCGASCTMFGVVDLTTGKLITAPGVESVVGNHLDADDFLKQGYHQFWGARYRKDSALLVLVGMINEDETKEGAFYYVLRDGKLKLVHKTFVKKKCP